MLLCTTNDDEIMEMFLEIKFHSNENIEWHCIQLEFNSNIICFNPNSIQLNSYSQIEFKKPRCKLMLKISKFSSSFPLFVTMVLKNK
jgi:hypothetical protein